MAHITTEVCRLMESEGFTRIRAGAHFVWRDAWGVQVNTAASPSDRHALSVIRRNIKRVRREHGIGETRCAKCGNTYADTMVKADLKDVVNVPDPAWYCDKCWRQRMAAGA